VEQHRARIIAPRLASGEKRIGFGHGLPPAVKEGIRRIAERENKSMSWVMEEVIVQFFHLRPPTYLPRKASTPPGPPEPNVPPAKRQRKTNPEKNK
jgi:hypothetical protein